MEPLLTTEQIAQWLQVEVVTVRRLVSRGELAAHRVGGEFRFTRQDVQDFLARQRVEEGVGRANDRLDKFTGRARKVLALAQEEAQRCNHEYLGNEHLFLGLVREGEGVAARVLGELGVELDQVRSVVQSSVGRRDRAIAGEIRLTPRSKRVLQLAGDEAHRLGHSFVGTEHLLLALAYEGALTAGDTNDPLSAVGVDWERARALTLHELALIQHAGENERQ